MDAVGRVTQLTLSRREWIGVTRALHCLPRIEESCKPAIATLQSSLEQQRCGPEQPLSIRQSPL
ncbi:MAG TPA: hypothetical protein VHS28_07115, partial [Chloroflexota bacterium]|nr:hypothetical protein [Chloroflexota bacterium]